MLHVVQAVGDDAELNTAVNQQLALTVFVLKNQAYAMERNKMLAEGLETLVAELSHIDLSTVAGGLGAKAYQVKTEAELEPGSYLIAAADVATTHAVVTGSPATVRAGETAQASVAYQGPQTGALHVVVTAQAGVPPQVD